MDSPHFDPGSAFGGVERAFRTPAVARAGFVTLEASYRGPDNGAATMVWFSPDAMVWESVDVLEGVRLGAVVTGGPGLVAVGHEDSDNMGLDDTQAGLQPFPIPAVWTSTDGHGWAAADTIDTAPFDYGEIHDLALLGSGFIAVGQVWDANKQSRPAVWTSPDGRSWVLQPVDPLGPIGDRDRILMQVAVGEGGFVAVGQIQPYEGDGPGPILMWWSQDGVVWERASVAPGSFTPGSSISKLVAFGSGFVMVGAGGAVSGVAWISGDGREWSESIALPTRLETGSSFVNDLATDGSILVAVGDDVIFGPGTSPATGDASIWTSTNGSDWVQMPPEALRSADVLDQVAAASIVQLNDVWVVLGSSHSQREDVSVGLVWLGQ